MREGFLKAVVTGGAGFVGSRLCSTLARNGAEVVAFDNLATGSLSNLRGMEDETGFKFVRGDCRKRAEISGAISDADVVFHLAAKSAVRLDRYGPRSVYDNNVRATQVLLEAIKESRSRLVFASSSTVYGEAQVHPTPETYAPLLPISIYGASKLASEALISGYSRSFGFDAAILRLANVVGEGATHGVVPAFVSQLRSHPEWLDILGDGSQRKSYVYVDDCVEAFILAAKQGGLSVYNVGTDDQAGVLEIAKAVARALGCRPELRIRGGVDGGRGWTGDVKDMLLATKEIRGIGWSPRYGSIEAIGVTLSKMLAESN